MAHTQQATRLLNEIAQALVTLLDQVGRRESDIRAEPRHGKGRSSRQPAWRPRENPPEVVLTPVEVDAMARGPCDVVIYIRRPGGKFAPGRGTPYA
jgi:hypothetical protein